jgi:hypothetical protein
MRCVDCGQSDATVIWVQGSGVYRDVRREGDPELVEPLEVDESLAPTTVPDSKQPRRGPNAAAAFCSDSSARPV